MINYFQLHNQKLCANVIVVICEFVWERKCVTIIKLHWSYRKIKIQTTSKVSIRHENHFTRFFFFRTMGLLANLVSRFTCITWVISMRVQVYRFPVSNCCNKNLESNWQVNKHTTLSINQMVILFGKSHRLAVW